MPESVVGSLFDKTLCPLYIARHLFVCLFVCLCCNFCVLVVVVSSFYIISLALLIKLQSSLSAINLNLIFIPFLFQSY